MSVKPGQAQALAILRADPTAAVFVGDTPSDVEAGRAAGTRVIGYANKPHKLRTLIGADAVTTDMQELADALQAHARDRRLKTRKARTR